MAENDPHFPALTMNGDRIVVILCGVGLMLLGAVMVWTSIEDVDPLLLVLCILVFGSPFAWWQYQAWRGRRSHKNADNKSLTQKL